MPGSPSEPLGVVEDTLRDVHYVAHRLSVPTRRVYELAESGAIGHYKIGHRTLRFSDEHIDAFLSAREVAV